MFMSVAACALLLLLNFPAAASIAIAVAAIETSYIVEVRNESPLPLTSAHVVGGGCDINFGAISPNGRERRTFWIQHDGQLDFEASQGNTKISKPIDGYVTGNLGGRVEVAVQVDGKVSVIHRERDGAVRPH